MELNHRSASQSRREPLAEGIARADRAHAGRTTAPGTPLDMRGIGTDLSPAMHLHAQERLGFKLGKFARDIDRVVIRMLAPDAGHAWHCKAQVTMPGLPSVVVDHSAANAFAALDGLLDRVERAVRRSHTRRLHGRAVRARRAARDGRRSEAFDDASLPT